MNIAKAPIQSLWAGIGVCCTLLVVHAFAADPGSSVPSVVQKGFTLYEKFGPEPALATWLEGGLLERDNNKKNEQTEISNVL